MKLEREPDSQYDTNAVKVVFPTLQEIDPTQRNLITREGNRPQRVWDVAGKIIGHIPRDISTFVAEGIDEGHIKRAYVVHTGYIKHDGPQIGGGVNLMFGYHFEVIDDYQIYTDL